MTRNSQVVLFVQTYAVYNQSRIILATLGPSGLALIVLDGVSRDCLYVCTSHLLSADRICGKVMYLD